MLPVKESDSGHVSGRVWRCAGCRRCVALRVVAELDAGLACEGFGGGIIANQATMTIWFEGEIWLEAGSTEVFELAPKRGRIRRACSAGTTAYARLIEDAASVPAATPQTGWYRSGSAVGMTAVTSASASGTSYQQVFDDVRAELVRVYLGNLAIKTVEVAYLLGFAQIEPCAWMAITIAVAGGGHAVP
jgi:hypothetical protein